ncbi:MAG: GAF domain-containing protein [Chloroflexi bacterium]|nr:GAF domain-containing protein [Chloroflexota bacterium]
MNRFQRTNYARILLGLIALAAIARFWLIESPSLPTPGLSFLTVLGVAIAANVPIALRLGEVTVTHLIGLGATLVQGPVAAAALAGLGLLIGGLARASIPRLPGFRDVPRLERSGLVAFDFAQIVLTILAAGTAYGALGGVLPPQLSTSGDWLAVGGLSLGWLAAHNAVKALDLWWSGEGIAAYYRDNRIILLFSNLAPLPLALYAASSRLILNAVGDAILLGALVVASLAVYRVSQIWLSSETRVRELSSLNKVSRALRTSLDLDALLDTIYLQVAHLLNVGDFYIALYDQTADTISFALAIKDGVRQKWASRPSTNRLTDWIVRNRAPLLIPYDVPGTLNRLGLERGDVEPQSFMGVPLVASDRAIGCMAVLSYSPGERFNVDQLSVFNTLAAQAAVAIENAQLYGVTQRRAAELASLARIATLVSATLDPDRVLELVCSSILPLVRADKSAIFLMAEDRQELYLARAEGLSEYFLRDSLTVPLSNTHRVKAVTTGQPVTVADVTTAHVPSELRLLAEAEGFRAYADIPLAAQREIIGYLAVYFAAPRHFKADEIELLKTFANQAALAVTNARLHARTDQALGRRVEQLSALDEISRELAARLDLNRVFDVVLARAIEATGGAAASLSVNSDRTGRIEVVAARGYPDDFIERLSARPETDLPGITGRVQRLGQYAIVRDVSLDPDFVPGAAGTRSQLSVPIKRDGRVLGVITVESPEVGAFTQEHAKFVSQFSIQAALAIENARLFQRVAEGRDQLAAILNSTRDGVLMLDSKGRIALVNPRIEEFWGIRRSDLLDRSLDDLAADPMLGIASRLGYLPEHLQDMLDGLRSGRGLSGTAQRRTQYRIIVPKPRDLERTALPVMDERAGVIGWLIALRDITEQKELEKDREDLSNMIVHDLRSPLTAILGSVELIREYLPPFDDQTIIMQALEVSSRSTKKLLNLVNSLLDISRMETGDVSLNRRVTQLQALVQDVLADLGPLADEQGIKLLARVPTGIPSLSIDDEKVGRIFTNLIDNALKFTPPGGEVIIEAQIEGDHPPNGDLPPSGGNFVTCQVADSGPGIPDDYRDRIFESFVQVPGQSGRRKGTGLGLAFCKLAVEAHGGRIWVSSRPEGGSVFNFTLPVAQE